MNDMTDGHIVRSYNEEMNHLHQHVMQIGELVRDQLKRAVKSLRDEDEAREVIERDQIVEDRPSGEKCGLVPGHQSIA